MVFCLPNANPVGRETLNYTPVAVGIVVVLILISWFASARKWFVGPIRQIELERAGVNVDDPAAVAAAEEQGIVPDVETLKKADVK